MESREIRRPGPARLRTSLPAAVALVLAVLVGASVAPGVGQTAEPVTAQPALSTKAYTLRHQPAADALALISPLLSERGSVELQPVGNTIVVRDLQAHILRIVPVLRNFDHPRRDVRIEVRIVRASVQPTTGAARVSTGPSELSAVLTSRLRELLRFQHYDLLAGVDLASREVEELSYDVGEDYRVDMRVGTVLATRRIKLHDFRISRAKEAGEWKQLIHTNLELTLGEPMVLGLATTEASEHALMVVLTCQQAIAGETPLTAE